MSEIRVLRADALESTEAGHSGADRVGAAPQEGLTFSNGQQPDSVMGQLYALYSRTAPALSSSPAGNYQQADISVDEHGRVTQAASGTLAISKSFETHIDGLTLEWVSSTAIRVGSGSAWVPGQGDILDVGAAIDKSGLSLLSNAYYWLYLYDNASVAAPDVEIVVNTTANHPVLYKGTARHKPGDPTRRYIGAVRTDGTGSLYEFYQEGGLTRYITDSTVAPFRVLLGGTASTFTNVSCQNVVPPTSRYAFGRRSVSGATAFFSIPGRGQLEGYTSTKDGPDRFLLDTTRAFSYRVLSGGSVAVDILGYWEER